VGDAAERGGGRGEPLTMAGAIRQLRAGEMTAAALAESCLARIERLEPVLKACVTVMAEAARAQAREADAALATGRDRRPLLGVPLGIKDLIETAGVRTTAGSRVLEDWVPERDATVVTRLREAGGIALCKTNTHEFAFGTLTPPTANPWDLARSPGGSSGGSAAAVAAGECLGALGTDTGGSIRIPASWCGVTGLKPTFGLVGRGGIVPLSCALDHAGPIARTVEDCALLLDVLAGHDPDDPDSLDVPQLDYTSALQRGREPEEAVRRTRIGVPANYFFEQVEGETARLVRAAIGRLRELGAEVVEVRVPEALESAFSAIYRAIQKPEAFTYHEDQGWLADRADRYTPELRELIISGGAYTAADYVRAQRARRALTAAMEALLREVDVLATPTTPVPAATLDEAAAGLRADGVEIAGGSLRLTFPFDLTGEPALSVPCGFTAAGLPVGLQLAARRFGEATLLRVGHAYQRSTDWHQRQPPI